MFFADTSEKSIYDIRLHETPPSIDDLSMNTSTGILTFIAKEIANAFTGASSPLASVTTLKWPKMVTKLVKVIENGTFSDSWYSQRSPFQPENY